MIKINDKMHNVTCESGGSIKKVNPSLDIHACYKGVDTGGGGGALGA